MRRRGLGTLMMCAAGLAVAAPAAAHGADPVFAPYVSSPLPNGAGPGPAPVNTVTLDLDGDNLPDVATTNDFGQREVLLARNSGGGSFAAAGLVGGTRGAQSVAAGDVNGDGADDIVAMTPSEVIVAVGDGSGGFTTSDRKAARLGGQVQAIVADLDGDGDLDIAAQTFTAIQTLLGRGDGTFASGPASQVPGTLAIAAIAAADLNGDANTDLLAVDGATGQAIAMLGAGSGAFHVSGRLATAGLVPEDVQPIDLNADGFDDLAAIGSFSFSLATALGDQRGGFAGGPLPVFQGGGPGPTSLGVADFNRDGLDDIVVSDVANPFDTRLLVFAGDGTAKPRRSGSFPVAPFPQTPAIADYDADGRPDVAVAGPGELSVLLNRTP